MSTVERRPAVAGALLPAALVGAGLLLLGAATAAGRGIAPTAGFLVLLSVVAVGYNARIRWAVLVALVVLVVLVIPIKRYQLAVALPFDLEAYRIVIAIVL